MGKCDAEAVLKFNGWKVEYRAGGWVRVRDDTGVTVFLRVLPTGEGGAKRFRAHLALMSSSDPITARTWRDVPFASIEGHILIATSYGDAVRALMEQPAEVELSGSLADLNRYFDETEFSTGGHIPTDVVIAEPGEPRANFELVRPPDGRITDEFLENLAEMYRWLVESGKAPAPGIAETADVPVRTVHRWVGEARKRGFLPPGIKGRAG